MYKKKIKFYFISYHLKYGNLSEGEFVFLGFFSKCNLLSNFKPFLFSFLHNLFLNFQNFLLNEKTKIFSFFYFKKFIF